MVQGFKIAASFCGVSDSYSLIITSLQWKVFFTLILHCSPHSVSVIEKRQETHYCACEERLFGKFCKSASTTLTLSPMQLPLWASCDSWDCCWQTQLNQLTIILISKVALLRKWSYVSWRCAAAALRSTFITDKQKMLRFKGSVVNMEAVYSCQVKSVLKDGLQESASNQKGCCLRLKKPSVMWCHQLHYKLPKICCLKTQG